MPSTLRHPNRDRHSRTRYWLPEFPSCRSFFPAPRDRCLGWDHCKIACQIASRVATQSGNSAQQILLEKRVAAPVFAKTLNLTLDVLGSSVLPIASRPLAAPTFRSTVQLPTPALPAPFPSERT